MSECPEIHVEQNTQPMKTKFQILQITALLRYGYQLSYPAVARAYFDLFFPIGFQNLHSDMKFTAKDAKDAKNTGQFDVSATRIQWKTSRTRIPLKIRTNKFKFDFAYPSNPRLTGKCCI